jgi:hypothetical protein
MSDHNELIIDGAGPRPMITKVARGSSGRDRLRHEARVLRAAEHPGVTVLVAVDESDGEFRLRTAFCGSRTLATAGSMPIARVAGIVASLATTVADLHELGVVHRRITADHVLIGPEGRPVLCGFAEAALDQRDPSARADDVESLGRLLLGLLEHHDDLAPIPPTRLGRRSAWSGYQRRALLNLADQATGDDAHLRPTARQLAQSIRSTVPDATLVDHRDDASNEWDPDARSGGREGWAPSRNNIKVAAVAVVCVVGLTIAFVGPRTTTGDDDSEDSAAAEVTHLPQPDSDQSPPTDTSTAHTWTSTPTMIEEDPTPTPPPAPIDVSVGHRAAAAGCSTLSTQDSSSATLASGQPCPTTLEYSAGLLTIGTEQFELGLEDAAVAIGDFACEGAPRAAVLDRSTGHVFVFDAWAVGTDPVTAQALRTIDGGGRLLAEPAGSEGCHRLVALDTYGIRYVITLEDSRS